MCRAAWEERVTIIKPREDKGGHKCFCRANWKKTPNCDNTAEFRVGRSADFLYVQSHAHAISDIKTKLSGRRRKRYNLPLPPSPRINAGWGGGGVGCFFFIGITMSVCPVQMSNFVRMILLNHSAASSQTWYCGVLSWGSVQCKKIGLLSSLKVTARAYNI